MYYSILMYIILRIPQLKLNKTQNIGMQYRNIIDRAEDDLHEEIENHLKAYDPRIFCQNFVSREVGER